ncbi:flagellar biosynthesis anti-sigma factor FlgM [Shewanella psychropiezotolerans]|uniref:Negative regulator of flagellin synthesis n=1 Tax=Shewanella psychropiezotolerans TaxID=2593655 RepID=A0ABX5WS64_9GAMM|nr:flagellar biosynthesis anti-sigma factor FlgM [Shewanella psychropiezotolerans]QDO81955.1 flagellar biosynthesis anti-sigma factor FlgM [Shewanella psychropiezotolerans]
MEIQKINSAISTEISTKKDQAQPLVKQDNPEKSIQAEHKVVSDDWQLLTGSQSELELLEDVDQARIDEIRQSLKSGTFKLDLDAISEAMLQQHS